MKVYHLETPGDARSGGIFWSETKKRRKPDRDAVRWYASHSDGFPLGPLPSELKDLIAGHWALTDSKNSKLPDAFTSLEVFHFTGLQAVNTKMAQLFERLGGDDIELFQIPNFWSLSDKAEIYEPYYFANVYGAELTVDLKRSKVMKVVNPKYAGAQRYFLSGVRDERVKLTENFQTDRHIWRDSSTSDWFCDDVFREALEAASPRNYRFFEVSAE